MFVSEFLAICEKLWPSNGAEEWDNPGLSVGSLSNPVTRILVSVDVTEAVLDEAISVGADVVFSHHPLILRGLLTAAEESYKGSLISKATRNNLTLISAHTNADVVTNGVSDQLAKQLGLENLRPLVATDDTSGHGRVGELPATVSLGDFVAMLAQVLPATTRGISSTASADLQVRNVAVCGGAGDSFISQAFAAGADVYVTSDLRHHVAQESPLPLIDVSHWASESLWLEVAAAQLAERCPGVVLEISSVNTDPWLFNEGRTK